MRIHVGTSGYNYPEWRGTFYSAGLSAKAMFGFYAAVFQTVEINYTFYRMPTAKNADAWRTQAPPGFSYALKAPRRITHDKRLQECRDLVASFTTCARALGPALAPVLFQLPPNLKVDVARLRAFLGDVPADIRCAFEFRHESWLVEEVFQTLRDHGAALCIADFGDKTTPFQPTARYGYFRLRDEGYVQGDLDRWASAVAAQTGQWDDVWVFFKHEDEGKGPEFARQFIEALRPLGLALAWPRSET